MRVYNLGAVKPWVRTNATMLGHRYSLTVIGGWRPTGSVPNSDHPKGLAADFMASIPVGQRIVADALKNWDAYNIKYIIHNRRIWNSPASSEPYNGPSPHTDHVHISYDSAPNGGPGDGGGTDGIKPIAGDSGDDGNSSTLEDIWGGITGVGRFIGNVIDLVKFLTDPTNWKRIGLALAGGLLMLFGFLSITRGQQTIDLRKVL